MSISRKIKANMENQSWIRRMFEEGIQLKQKYGPENIFDFSLGVPMVSPPEDVLETLKSLVASPKPGVHTYMPNSGFADVRSTIADYLSKNFGLAFTENHIVMTVGAGGGLNVALKSIIDEGDEIIILSPYFVEYTYYVENHGGRVKTVQTKDDFTLDIESIEQAINPNTKGIIVNSPNNPTGVVYDEESLVNLTNLLRQSYKKYGKEIYVLSDEVYRKIVYDGVQVPSILERYEYSLLIYSHSKDLSLAGERIGFVAVNPNLKHAKDLFSALVFSNRTLGFVNAPALMQRLVKNSQQSCVDVDEYREKRDLFYDALVEYGYSVVKPEGSFFLFPRSLIEDDVAFVKELKTNNILATPGSGFGRKGYFRLAYCVGKDVIERSLPGFKEAAEKYVSVNSNV